jgi:putative membrane protein
MEQTLADRRLHPATLFIRFLKKAPQFVLGLPAVIGFSSKADIRFVLLIAAAGAAVTFGAALLSWLRFRYGIGTRDVVIESGVFNRQRRVIPFDRVQDIDIEQGLLARLFQIAKVRIETGGAAKNEGDLDAVGLAEAHRIRDIIRHAAHDVPQSDIERPAPTEPLLFAIPLRRLMVAGLFNFSLIYLAAIGGAIQYLQPLIERNLFDVKAWIAPAWETAPGVKLAATLALVALVLFLGVLTGIARTITRDYRFRLTRTAAGFRRQRGLLTLSEAVIPLRRVQLAILGTGWLRKRFGWFSLNFQTLGADVQKSGYQAAAPFGRIEEIMPILAEANMAELPPLEDYVRVSVLTIPRRCLSILVPLGLVGGVVSLFRPLALLLFVPMLLIALVIALQWRRHRYALSGRAVHISEGIFRQRLWIVPFANAQTFSVTRSPLQRQFGLASLAVDTAGASLMRYPLIRDMEAPVAEALAKRLLEEFRFARAAAKASPVEVIDAVDERSADPALHEQGERDRGEAPDDRAAVHRSHAPPHPDSDTAAGKA